MYLNFEYLNDEVQLHGTSTNVYSRGHYSTPQRKSGEQRHWAIERVGPVGESNGRTRGGNGRSSLSPAIVTLEIDNTVTGMLWTISILCVVVVDFLYCPYAQSISCGEDINVETDECRYFM